VTSTVTIPPGTRLVGEAWSVLAGRGPAFQDQDNPQVIFKVGEEGSQGVIEITDIVFATVGPGKFWYILYHVKKKLILMKTSFQLLVQLLSSGISESQTVCKQAQECGIRTSGMYLKQGNIVGS
jgi:hypothetical protein